MQLTTDLRICTQRSLAAPQLHASICAFACSHCPRPRFSERPKFDLRIQQHAPRIHAASGAGVAACCNGAASVAEVSGADGLPSRSRASFVASMLLVPACVIVNCMPSDHVQPNDRNHLHDCRQAVPACLLECQTNLGLKL